MLKKAFHKQYEGIVWKIRPDESGSYLALEIRNAEKKEVFFSGIHAAAGTLAFDGLQLQESWFCGLEGAAHGLAYLHGYLSETLPEHRGIFAVRLENGRVIWEDYNLVFSHTAKEGLIAWNYKSEPRKYQLIDPAGGATIRSFASREELEQSTSPTPSAPVILPSKTKLDEEWLAHLPSDALPSADLLEWHGRWLLAFYTRAATASQDAGASEDDTLREPDPGIAAGVQRTEPSADAGGKQKMDHHIYVFDSERELIHKDLLAEDILHPAMDTFFVMGDHLYYIKSKSEILAYCL